MSSTIIEKEVKVEPAAVKAWSEGRSIFID